MKNVISFFGKIIFPLAILFTSCDTMTLAVSDRGTAHFGETVIYRSEGIPCGGTSPFDPDFGLRTSSRIPHAGFKSNWNPGADPIPCKTIQSSICRSVFRFDLTEFLASHRLSDLESATLMVTGFNPIGGDVHVKVTQAWGYDIGFIPRPPDLNYADFTVKAVTTPWEPMEILTGTRNSPISSVPLIRQNENRNVFRAPLASGPVTFIVTNEIQQMNADPTRGDRTMFGFVIEPSSIQSRYMSSNYAYGSFEVQLRLVYRRR